MSDYTPSADEAREDTIDWLILLGVSPVGAERGVDSLIEAVRAEEREKAAQIAEDSYEDQPTWLRNGIARLIREQGS